MRSRLRTTKLPTRMPLKRKNHRSRLTMGMPRQMPIKRWKAISKAMLRRQKLLRKTQKAIKAMPI